MITYCDLRNIDIMMKAKAFFVVIIAFLKLFLMKNFMINFHYIHIMIIIPKPRCIRVSLIFYIERFIHVKQQDPIIFQCIIATL